MARYATEGRREGTGFGPSRGEGDNRIAAGYRRRRRHRRDENFDVDNCDVECVGGRRRRCSILGRRFFPRHVVEEMEYVSTSRRETILF